VLDRPFAIIRNGYTYDNSPSMQSWAGATEVSPHQSWRGTNDLGTYTDGHGVYIAGFSLIDSTSGHCRTPSSGGTVCMTVIWPEQYAGMYGNPTQGFAREQWFGSLAQDKLDNSGQLYKRNRYYDPSSGRFTQEDPIGLAGGLNAYGFAKGNPVSYNDPFGLSPCSDLRTNIDDSNHDYDIRSLKYLLYGLIGMHDTGHYEQLSNIRNRLNNLTQRYDSQCRGTDDDDENWPGGTHAKGNIKEFEQLPNPAVKQTHGYRPAKKDPEPNTKQVPIVIPLPVPLPEFPLPIEIPIIFF